MKRILFVFAALFATAFAQAPALTSTTVFYRFQADPVFDASGNPTAAPVQAYWKTTVTDSTGRVVASSTDMGAQWDAVATGAQTITITNTDGSTLTLTRAQVLQAVMAIANQVKAGG